MDSSGLLEQVNSLRQQGSTPKQIAKALGIRPAEATRLVRAAAAKAPTTEHPVVGCWLSPGWTVGLTVDGYSDQADRTEGTGSEGLINVLVARRHRHDKVVACGYLIDAYCLGVKNTIGPIHTDDLGLHRLVPQYFQAYEQEPIPAPIDLAREVVLGAVDYARGLGFEPHADFAEVVADLGDEKISGAVTFGEDGRPVYINGPYDNPDKVIRTLTETVGKGNFDVVIRMG